MVTGAELVVRTVQAIESGNVLARVQEEVYNTESMPLKPAPKIQKDDCRINWDDEADAVNNFIRGLSPHPGAYTELKTDNGSPFYLKVFRAQVELVPHSIKPSGVICDGRTYLKVAVRNGFIHLIELQPAGRKPMNSLDFLKGYGRHFI